VNFEVVTKINWIVDSWVNWVWVGSTPMGSNFAQEDPRLNSGNSFDFGFSSFRVPYDEL